MTQILKIFLSGFFNTLPLPVVGGLVAAALYGVASRVWPRSSATAVAPRTTARAM